MGFKDSRLRSQLSDPTREGLAGGALWSALPRVAYTGGGVESHEGESRQAPAGVMDISIGMSFEWLLCGGLVRPSDTTYSAGDKVGEGAPLELNEIKIDSLQSPFAPCFPPFGNLMCIFIVKRQATDWEKILNAYLRISDKAIISRINKLLPVCGLPFHSLLIN